MKAMALAALLSTTVVAPVQEFSFEAETNAWPVHGRSDNTIRIHADLYDLDDLSRHDGQLITADTYHDEKVTVLGDGNACVDRVECNADGWADVFAASITHTCGNQPFNAFRARVDFSR